MSYEVELNGGKQDVSLEDLAGLDMDTVELFEGGFDPTPKGSFRFLAKDVRLDEIADKPVIKFELEIVACHAIDSETKDGNTVLGLIHEENIFINDVAKSFGYAKAIMQAAGFTGTGTSKQLFDAFCGTQFDAVIKQKPKKDDPDVIYANLKLKSISPVVAE